MDLPTRMSILCGIALLLACTSVQAFAIHLTCRGLFVDDKNVECMIPEMMQELASALTLASVSITKPAAPASDNTKELLFARDDGGVVSGLYRSVLNKYVWTETEYDDDVFHCNDNFIVPATRNAGNEWIDRITNWNFLGPPHTGDGRNKKHFCGPEDVVKMVAYGEDYPNPSGLPPPKGVKIILCNLVTRQDFRGTLNEMQGRGELANGAHIQRDLMDRLPYMMGTLHALVHAALPEAVLPVGKEHMLWGIYTLRRYDLINTPSLMAYAFAEKIKEMLHQYSYFKDGILTSRL
ncbi:hypothetical protein BDV95DRAFT_618999 [Massariosphaeria phaeospora]|uniref:Uncharacterized protein n=1 Tax=Massariosphaeria phaeospora TaxID=100035 RepID=A0A7C8MEV9_9PLEO|nr:hypothetical protein BDV95DRAFT_618999 [Massariosphaeria phaeospora]